MLVPERPSVEFLCSIRQAGFPLPEFVPLKGRSIDLASGLQRRKIGSLRPWAWGPDSTGLLKPLFTNVTSEARTANQLFNEGIARLYSKSWSAEFLRALLSRSRRPDEVRPARLEDQRRPAPADAEPWLCTEREVGVIVDTLEGALEAITTIRRKRA